MQNQRVMAVASHSEHDVSLLTPSFKRLWPVDETPCFSSLLLAIDEAERLADREAEATARE